MRKLYLAFVWHFHQPCYKDMAQNVILMPWVRLHGIKDYTGMAIILQDFPKIKVNVNLSPSLLEQLKDYQNETCFDKAWIVSEKPPHQLSDEDKQWITDNFFYANFEHMIKANKRYFQLFQKKELRQNFTEQDILDLQTLANLCWFHPEIVKRYEILQSLIKQGSNFTQQQKQEVLQIQKKILSDVINRWSELGKNNQVELITNAYYHPILPLLHDMMLAKVALPNVSLPSNFEILKEDTLFHITEAINYHQKLLGARPEGMWLPEQAVSEEIISILAEQKIRWTVLDEEILQQSLKSYDRIKHLYKAYYYEAPAGEIFIVFRDKELSNLISFSYKHLKPEGAVNDFIQRIKNIYDNTKNNPLVVVALDGENPWEYYENNGVDFLRGLYSAIEATDFIQTVCLSNYLKENLPTNRLTTIYPGSWISHNYGVWIAHEEDRNAWQVLINTKKDILTRLPQLACMPEEEKRDYLRSFYASEGSDWFWWYGDDFYSPLSGEYDYIFRKHLINTYLTVGLPPPEKLFQKIKQK